MGVLIAREGIDPDKMPRALHDCPVCGEYSRRYRLDQRVDSGLNFTTGVPQGVAFAELQPKPQLPLPALVPTFTCTECGCIWQWIPEKD